MNRALAIASLVLAATAAVMAMCAQPACASPIASAWFGVAPVEVDGEQRIELRMSGGTSLTSAANTFGADAVVIEHNYFQLTESEVGDLIIALNGWIAAPHSLTVFDVPGSDVGLSLTGSSWNPNLTPIVVVNIQYWTLQGRGNLHGGTYAALNASQVTNLAEALELWASKPMPGDLLYQVSFQ